MKKATGYIKLQIPAGKANPAPPVGPALGQHAARVVQEQKRNVWTGKIAIENGLGRLRKLRLVRELGWANHREQKSRYQCGKARVLCSEYEAESQAQWAH